MTNQTITFKYLLSVLIAIVSTWLIHEFAHWACSELFGYDTIMRINGISSADGVKPTELQIIIMTALGPLATFLQGLSIFLLLTLKNWNKQLYPFLFTAFYMRFMAGLVSIWKPNDEARISEFLGIGTLTLPIIISGLLFFMVYYSSKKHKLNWKFQVTTGLMVLILSTILIHLDDTFRFRIL